MRRLARYQVGSALAAWGAGAMRTVLGSYTEAFVFAGATCFIAAAFALAAGRGPHRSRAQPVPA